jgi:hypothetical protein
VDPAHPRAHRSRRHRRRAAKPRRLHRTLPAQALAAGPDRLRPGGRHRRPLPRPAKRWPGRPRRCSR